MKVADNFRFYIDFPITGEIEVNPFNSKLKFCWKKDRKIEVYRYELDTQLIFKGATFDKLYELMKDCAVCYDIGIRIEMKCNGTWSDHYKGKLDLKKGSWSLSRCQVGITPKVDDEYSCMLRNWKNKKNLLEIEDRVDIGTSGTYSECEEKYFGQIDLFDLSQLEARMLSLYTTIYVQEFGFTSSQEYSLGSMRLVRNGQKYDVYYDICQEISDIQPVPSNGWVFSNGVWVRPLNNFGFNGGSTWFNSLTVTYPTNPSGIDLSFTNSVVNINIDNGIRLEDAFNFLLQDCNITICSDFFGFGPASGNAPLNDQYMFAGLFLQNIVLFQASDVIRASATNNATIFRKCLEELFSDFSLKYKLEIFYDDVSNCMRIENETWQEQKFMLDLTQDQFAPYLKGNREWTFDQEKLYSIETYKEKANAETPESIDFDQAYTEYNQNCVNEDLEDKEYKTNCTLTDLASFYENEEYADDDEILQSMFIIALDSFGNVIRSFGAYSGVQILNAPLAWANVIDVFWRDKKHQLFGEMNGKPTQFNSLDFLRQQNALSFPFCCEDWNMYNPNHRTKTQLGWGVTVSDVCWTFPLCAIEDLELAFKC